MEAGEFPRRTADSIDESPEDLFHSRRCCCCFLPNSWWSANPTAGGVSLWARSVAALMKVREWSELVAGPRWKTFIRRFNRTGRRHANLQYDPLSYAMNFDDGPGHFGHFDEDGEDDYFYGSRNFSSRYARGSVMDQAKDGPSFV